MVGLLGKEPNVQPKDSSRYGVRIVEPILDAMNVEHHLIEITWDNSAEVTNDVVTGYSDFEGYSIYKSLDGGITWGDPETDLYDTP